MARHEQLQKQATEKFAHHFELLDKAKKAQEEAQELSPQAVAAKEAAKRFLQLTEITETHTYGDRRLQKHR